MILKNLFPAFLYSSASIVGGCAGGVDSSGVAAYLADSGGGLVVYLCGGGAGRDSSPLVLGKAAGAWVAAGLEGGGEAVASRSMSMGWGVGWSAMADMADEESLRSSSGGRLSGCESRSYLDERLDEYDEVERRSGRSRSLRRAWDFLSGDEGGVPRLLFAAGFPGASLGMSGVFAADLDDLRKREGSTMRGENKGQEARCN